MKSLFNQPAQCYRYATESAGVKRFQKLLVYDLDRRDDSSLKSSDPRRKNSDVSGHFKGNTAHFLRELMKIMRNPDYLTATDQHLLRHVDIDRCKNSYANSNNDKNYIGLGEYLKGEYGYDYSDKRMGDIVDRQLLIGNIYTATDTANINGINAFEIDGFLELLEYNEKMYNRFMENSGTDANRLTAAIARDSTRTDWFDATLDGRRDNLEDGPWYEIRNENDTNPTYHVNNRPFNGELIRHHEGVDRAGSCSGIFASLFFRCRGVEDSSYNSRNSNNGYQCFWPSFEIIGVDKSIRILHLKHDSNVKVHNLYYPTEQITNYPIANPETGRGDGGYPVHVHIEKRRIRFLPYSQSINLMVNPDSGTTAAAGTRFYIIEYSAHQNLTERQLTLITNENGERTNSYPWYRRVTMGNGTFYTQPGSPF